MGRSIHFETYGDVRVVNGDIVDIVTVNLYNAKDPNDIKFEQRVIGEGNNAEEILAC